MSKEQTESGKVSSAKAERIITSLVLIAVGVLFCLKLANDVVHITIGIALCLYALINIVLAATKGKSLFSVEGILDGVILALGVACIVVKPLGLFVSLIPYLFIGVGAVFALDACLAFFVRKNINVFFFIVLLLVGLLAITLGFLLIFVDSVRSATSILFGLTLIAVGLYRLCMMIIKKN